MSGHSKWANIKHKKAKVDADRGKIFTKVSREIAVAARQGGGDPETNFRLRLAIDKARDANMPNESVIRAIKRGLGESEGSNYEELMYEGYGPGGVAILLEVLTDNRNRTASDVRYLFSKHGGNLGEAGCVAWMFEKKGLLVIDIAATKASEDDLMTWAIEAGAEDFRSEGDTIEIITSFEDFESVKKFLEERNVRFTVAEITMVPRSTVEVRGKEARQVLSLVEALEDRDDVQHVHANFDIPAEVMEEIAGA